MIATIAIIALLGAAQPAQEECIENQEEMVLLEEICEQEDEAAVLSDENCEQEDEALVLDTEEDGEYQDLAFFEDESEIAEELVIAEEE